MENHNQHDEWVANRLALLDPPEGWMPDAEEGYARFRHRSIRARMKWTWVAAAAAMFIAAIVLFPPARAVAERMLQFVRLSRLEVIRVNVDDLPADVKAALTANITTSPGTYQPAASVAEASRTVGFPVRLPGAGVLSGTPQLSTLRPLTAQLDLNVEALKRGLVHAGVRDLNVPDSWNNMTMIVFVSRSVTAAWPADITLMQSLPVSVSAPPNVQVPLLTEIGLRILGVEREPAKRLGGRMATNPGILLGIPKDESADIREVELRTGTGTLMHSFDENDGSLQRTELVWGTSDRLYALSGKMTDELAIAVANSIE